MLNEILKICEKWYMLIDVNLMKKTARNKRTGDCISAGNNGQSRVIDHWDLIHGCPKSFYYDQDDHWVFPCFKKKVFG